MTLSPLPNVDDVTTASLSITYQSKNLCLRQYWILKPGSMQQVISYCRWPIAWFSVRRSGFPGPCPRLRLHESGIFLHLENCIVLNVPDETHHIFGGFQEIFQGEKLTYTQIFRDCFIFRYNFPISWLGTRNWEVSETKRQHLRNISSLGRFLNYHKALLVSNFCDTLCQNRQQQMSSPLLSSFKMAISQYL